MSEGGGGDDDVPFAEEQDGDMDDLMHLPPDHVCTEINN